MVGIGKKFQHWKDCLYEMYISNVKGDWRWCLCPSLDRLDNELGYVQGNVAIVARFINVGFKDFSGDRDIVAGILFRDEPRPLMGMECLA